MPLPVALVENLRLGDADHAQIFQDFLDESGDPDFIDTFLGLCESAGMPDEDCDPQYCVKDFQRSGSKLTFDCEVYFDEKYFGSGCPDMPTIIPRSGTVTYEIDLDTGSLHGFIEQ